jgi:hypothetical protein
MNLKLKNYEKPKRNDMRTTKKFRIVIQFTVYSNRKKAYCYKNTILQKDIDTLEDAQRKVKEYKPTAEMKSPTEYRFDTPHYPGYIFIKQYKIMKSLKETIMERDELTSDEADELIEIARQRIYEENDDPEEVLHEEFGLEPDYIFDLIY